MTVTTHLQSNAKERAEQWLCSLQPGDTIYIRKDLNKDLNYAWSQDGCGEYVCNNAVYLTPGERVCVVNSDSDCSLFVRLLDKDYDDVVWISWSMVDLTQFEEAVENNKEEVELPSLFSTTKELNSTIKIINKNTPQEEYLQDLKNLQEAINSTFVYLKKLNELGITIDNIQQIELQSKYGKLVLNI